MRTSPRSTPTRATLVVGTLFLGGLLSGAWVGSVAAARATDPYAGLDEFARVLTTIEAHYVDPVDPHKLLNAAIEGMVDTLDPHSQWMSAEDLATFRDEARGSYEGIGIEVRLVPEGVLVASVLPGGPAERDGLLAGDVLLKVGDTSLAGRSLGEVGHLLKGPRGTSVVLQVQRKSWDAPRTLTTVRDRVITPAVTGERLSSGIAYVHLVQFQDGVARELTVKLHDLSEAGPLAGIVLDLRDDPGGLLDEAVGVADLFLDEGPIVSTRGRTEAEEVHDATPGGIPQEVPVVVLVNGLSASASEIVAGALQDTHRAVLVGTHTYGKGTVQVLFENKDGSALRLTTARYYTPSGKPVAPDKGRAPDHVVHMPPIDDPKHDLQQEIAGLDVEPAEREHMLTLVDELPDTPHADPIVPWNGTIAERRKKDPQLDYGLHLLEEKLKPAAP